MNIGEGCYIADKWIPKDVLTGLYDINGRGNKNLKWSKITRMYIRQCYCWFMW